jgi:hypothetical protein
MIYRSNMSKKPDFLSPDYVAKVLPREAALRLKAAAKTARLERVIQDVMRDYPQHFHPKVPNPYR